jgi:uncharacterized protein involved in exopolysaccharide biosynthesis
VEEEIDLREYIEVIVRRWKWIAGITIVAVVTAAIVSFFVITPVYEASATLLVMKPPLIPASQSLEAQVVEALLRSTNVEAQVVEALQETLSPSERVPGSLVSKVKVAQEGKSSVFKISARANDPQKAAQIANAWAEVGTEILREALAPTDGELKLAEQNLKAAEEALWELAEANGLAEADLRSLLGSRSNQWNINFFLGEGGVLGQRTSPSLSVESKMELASLLRRRDVAEEIYLSLSKEAEIAKITAQAGGGVEVISPAAVPSEPIQPRTKLNIAIAGVLGLMVGVFGAFLVEYFEGWEGGKGTEGNK